MSYRTYIKIPFSEAMQRRIKALQPPGGRYAHTSEFVAKLIREALDAREAVAKARPDV